MSYEKNHCGFNFRAYLSSHYLAETALPSFIYLFSIKWGVDFRDFLKISIVKFSFIKHAFWLCLRCSFILEHIFLQCELITASWLLLHIIISPLLSISHKRTLANTLTHNHFQHIVLLCDQFISHSLLLTQGVPHRESVFVSMCAVWVSLRGLEASKL